MTRIVCEGLPVTYTGNVTGEVPLYAPSKYTVPPEGSDVISNTRYRRQSGGSGCGAEEAAGKDQEDQAKGAEVRRDCHSITLIREFVSACKVVIRLNGGEFFPAFKNGWWGRIPA